MPIGVLLGIISALLTAVVTEVYAHRCLAHRAFRIHPGLAAVLHTYFRVVVGTAVSYTHLTLPTNREV